MRTVLSPLTAASPLRFQAAIESDKSVSKTQDLVIANVSKRYADIFANPLPMVVYFTDHGQSARLVFPKDAPLAASFVKNMIAPHQQRSYKVLDNHTVLLAWAHVGVFPLERFRTFLRRVFHTTRQALSFYDQVKKGYPISATLPGGHKHPKEKQKLIQPDPAFKPESNPGPGPKHIL